MITYFVLISQYQSQISTLAMLSFCISLHNLKNVLCSDRKSIILTVILQSIFTDNNNKSSNLRGVLFTFIYQATIETN